MVNNSLETPENLQLGSEPFKTVCKYHYYHHILNT
jgi:hypothetical protein